MIPLETLREVAFLEDLAEEYLQQLAAIAEIKDFPAGAVVFREVEDSLSVYLPLEGRVAVDLAVPRGTVRLLTIGTGELLGWTRLFGCQRLKATARALGPCRLLVLAAPQVLALCEDNPKLGMEFMRRTALALAQRLNAVELQLLDIYSPEVPGIPPQGGVA